MKERMMKREGLTRQGVRDLNSKAENQRSKHAIPCLPYTHDLKRIDDAQVCVKCGYVVRDPVLS